MCPSDKNLESLLSAIRNEKPEEASIILLSQQWYRDDLEKASDAIVEVFRKGSATHTMHDIAAAVVSGLLGTIENQVDNDLMHQQLQDSMYRDNLFHSIEERNLEKFNKYLNLINKKDNYINDMFTKVLSEVRDKSISSIMSHSMLSMNLEFDAVDKNQETPLHVSAKYGHPDIVLELLSKNMDVNTVDSYGNSPLHFAALNGNTSIISILLNAGANIDAVDKYGNTPLIFASQKGHKKAVEKLISAGADIHVIAKNGDTSINLAAYYKYEHIYNMLLTKEK